MKKLLAASLGLIGLLCCGTPTITSGREICGGTKNGSCFFTITQDICVAVPVAFGATASVGDTFVTCNGASADDICTTCEKIPVLPENPVSPAL